MDPINPLSGVNHATGGTDHAGHPLHSLATLNHNYNGDSEMYTPLPYPQPIPACPTQERQLQNPAVSSQLAPSYSVESMAAHAHSHFHRSSPLNFPPQHSFPHRQSPFSAQANSQFGHVAPAIEPVEEYPPESTPGRLARGRNSANRINRIILPPLPQSNTTCTATKNHTNGTVGVAGNSRSLSHCSAFGDSSAPGVGLSMDTTSNSQTHCNALQSLTQQKQSTLGKSKPISTTPIISTNDNSSNRSNEAGSVAASASVGVASMTSMAAPNTCSRLSTTPQPESKPPLSPLPQTKKSKDSMAAYHHPDLPFLVTHWIDHYASLSRSAATSEAARNNKPSQETTSNSEAIIAVEDGDETAKKEEALRRIQQAAKDLALAFETLGAFGDSCKRPLSSTGYNDVSNHSGRTTYTDLKRKYAPLLSYTFSHNVVSGSRNENTATASLLDSLVSASVSASAEASRSVLESSLPWSLLEAAYEGTVPTSTVSDSREAEITNERRKSLVRGAGRRLGDSTSDPSDASLESLLPSNHTFASAIRNPVLMGGAGLKPTEEVTDNLQATSGKLVMAVRSNFESVTKFTAQASRKYLCARIKVLEMTNEFEETRKALHSAMTRANTAESTLASVAATKETSEQLVANSDMDHHRVIAQLQRRIEEMHVKLSVVKKDASDAKKEAEEAFKEFSLVHGRYRDPYQISGKGHFSVFSLGESSASHRGMLGFASQPHALKNRNVILPAIIARQYQCRRRPSDFAQIQLSILKSRLSHAVTINCHLVYPVYCLKFDKTGKYFITGADDQLVKLFHLGAGPRHRGFNYGANMRGAVLVCTLRGHAGVVTDVDVSVDNALLATASADGDVRIWGLKDGCPVAILRGHKDGANMVSWSLLTPYRLVTCGDDGMARIWDVREAALKRYSDTVGNRADYTLPTKKTHQDGGCDNFSSESDPETVPPFLLPPTEPDTDANIQPVLDGHVAVNDRLQSGEGIGLARNVDMAGINENSGDPGEFIASDAIDEGVTLLAQLQHGEIVRESQQQGVGTRAQRKSVKVMCIARCPVGGHFCTGSDDGLVRVWADSDDIRVENVDKKISDSNYVVSSKFPSIYPMFRCENLSARQMNIMGSPSTPSKERLLATLSGHNNAITDMKYSSAGDRILTASMRDGVVRIWSWGKESSIIIDGHSSNTATSDYKHNSHHAKFSHLSQLLIRLTPAHHGDNREAGQSSRRKGLSSASNISSSVHCDGVTWTCNDMKIVTSQSSPAKASGTDIVPGSHMIYVWDSRSGRCLLGISGSHTSLCSTLVAHPFIPSVVVSAGSDGLANVWDLETGECFCSHRNVLSHGPIENASSRGKLCSYLEGQFSQDGSYLILSDESGRVTVFDTIASSSNPASFDPPSWMLEQYFANDYYELFYDANGYCIERGSERPPHLAPKGVRCSHEGVSVAEEVRDIYVNLSGPLPLSTYTVRLSRNSVRVQSNFVRMEGGVLSRNVRKKSTTLVESPGVLVGCKTTAIISADGKLFNQVRTRASDSPRTVNSSASGRPLSNRYTWVDFNDIPDEDDNDDDSDDEEYRGEGRRLRRAHDGVDVSSDDDLLDVDAVSPVSRPRGTQLVQRQRRSRGQRNSQDRRVPADPQIPTQPTRTSSRHVSRRTTFEFEDEDDEIEELVSTHTKPSGKYVQDWERANHFFKMPRGSVVHRKWLTRTNYQGSHYGTKMYCPQVGDSVVYIPRAHYDTLQRFPIGDYTAPWKSWQTLQPWPVVRCKVTHTRYRFPYEMYYPSRRKNEGLKDVAIILTLEITGLPLSCEGRRFPWPAPRFTSRISSRTRSREPTSFEVTMFDSRQVDFLIPEFLFTWRIRELEKAIARNGGEVTNLLITVSYSPDASEQGYESEDPFYKPYEAKLVAISPPFEDRDHFQDSGYNALVMNWLDNDEEIPVCVWDATIVGSTAPRVPMMAIETKNAINGALQKIMDLDPKVREWYDGMVDTRQYSDYLDLVEVPMFLSRIRERLHGNYYTNKDSVVADMELIKENCYKYNEDNNEFYDLACQMLEKFKSLVDAIPNPPVVHHDESDQDTGCTEDLHMGRASAFAATAGLSYQGRLRRGRNTSNGRLFSQQSSLATLPFSDDTEIVSRRSTRSAGIAYPLNNGHEESADDKELSSPESDNQESLESDDGESDTQVEEKHNSSQKTRASRRSSERAVSLSRRTKKNSNYSHHTIDDRVSQEEIHPCRRSGSRSSPNNSQHVVDVRTKRNYSENVLAAADDDYDDEEEGPALHSGASSRNQKSTRPERLKGKQERFPPTSQSSRASLGGKPHPIVHGHSTRFSSQSISRPIYTEEESDHEEDESPIRTRSSKPKKGDSGSYRSTRSRSVMDAASSMRKHRCRRSLTRGNHTIEDSDEEDSCHGESDSSESDEPEEYQNATARQRMPSRVNNEQVKPKLRLRMGKKSGNNDNSDEIHTRKSRRRLSPDKQQPTVNGLGVRTSLRPRGKATYTEKESDDDEYSDGQSQSSRDDDVSDATVSSVEERSAPRKKRSRSQLESCTKFNAGNLPTNKRGRSSPIRQRTRQRKRHTYYPTLAKWPNITKRLIPKVARSVLKILREHDVRGWFSIPVAEEYPAMAEEYLSIIDEPMDFRTIEEVRLPKYEHIHEFQNDLIITFRNCCVFNGEHSNFYTRTIEIWQSLNDIFKDACDENHVSLPQRFS